MMKLIQSAFLKSSAIAVILTVGFAAWTASAQDAAPAKELLEWVSKARKAGMSDQQIQSNAALAGWQEGAVNQALLATAGEVPSSKDAKNKPAANAGEAAKDAPAGSPADPAATAVAKPTGSLPAEVGAKDPTSGGVPSAGTTVPRQTADPPAGDGKPAAMPPAAEAAPKTPAGGVPAANGPASTPAAGTPKPDRGVPDDYEIGAGDALHINVFHEIDASVPSVVVRPDGKITMPLLKEVKAQGLTPSELEKEITTQLTKFLTAPDVTVIVTAINSKKIYAIGAVKKEGPIPYTYRMTVLQALSEAGGLTDYAKRKKIYVLRTQNGQQFKLLFDYDAVLKGEHMEVNYPLIAGDTIVVPH